MTQILFMNCSQVKIYLLITFVVLIHINCNTSKSYNATTVGEIEDLIKKGNMAEHIALKELQDKPNVYALGSVTNLKGFIVIENSRPFTSYITNNQVNIDSSWNTTATLLVYAQVQNWNEIEIPAAVKTYTQLEKFINDASVKSGLNTEVAFPFLLKGTVSSLNWRVSDWSPGDKEITNKKVKNSGLKGRSENVTTTVVGFYCTKQYRVLAEHDTKMHLHFISDDRKVSGHIDEITIDGRLRLYLPMESFKPS
ncbi:MAG: acetolactate decarboxylase [Chitinophagales bacterium]|nr:acetolactate decarboxylase [Chitinophagales bacterium]